MQNIFLTLLSKKIMIMRGTWRDFRKHGQYRDPEKVK